MVRRYFGKSLNYCGRYKGSGFKFNLFDYKKIVDQSDLAYTGRYQKHGVVR